MSIMQICGLTGHLRSGRSSPQKGYVCDALAKGCPLELESVKTMAGRPRNARQQVLLNAGCYQQRSAALSHRPSNATWFSVRVSTRRLVNVPARVSSAVNKTASAAVVPGNSRSSSDPSGV